MSVDPTLSAQLLALQPGESITVWATLAEMAEALAEVKRQRELEGRTLIVSTGLEGIDDEAQS